MNIKPILFTYDSAGMIQSCKPLPVQAIEIQSVMNFQTSVYNS